MSKDLVLSIGKSNDLMYSLKLGVPQRQTSLQEFFNYLWTCNVTEIATFSGSKINSVYAIVYIVHAKLRETHHNILLISDESSDKPLLSGHLPLPWGWPLNRGFTVLSNIICQLCWSFHFFFVTVWRGVVELWSRVLLFQLFRPINKLPNLP